MKCAVCQVSVAPLRAEADDSSEMISQLLFGEKVEVLETNEKWAKIKSDFDEYEGWVDPKQLLTVPEEEYKDLKCEVYTADAFNLALDEELPLTLPIGCTLINYERNLIQFGTKKIEYFGEFISGKQDRNYLIELAKSYLNVPYLWGGKSTFGIDCSGLVQQVFKMSGYVLPRDAWQQAEHGEILSFVEEAESGDLAFFDNAQGKIIHVGIVIGDRKILHAHGKVRIDPFDSNGIFNTDSQKYSHKLRFLKRIIEN